MCLWFRLWLCLDYYQKHRHDYFGRVCISQFTLIIAMRWVLNQHCWWLLLYVGDCRHIKREMKLLLLDRSRNESEISGWLWQSGPVRSGVCEGGLPPKAVKEGLPTEDVLPGQYFSPFHLLFHLLLLLHRCICHHPVARETPKKKRAAGRQRMIFLQTNWL